MENKQRKSVLTHLSKKAAKDPIAKKAILKEFSKILSCLEQENHYEILAEHLDLLDTFAHIVFDETVNSLKHLIKRFEKLDLEYQEILWYSQEKIRKHENNFTLVIKSLELLANLRYYLPSKILDVFFEYSIHQNESVAKQAIMGIEKLANFDLNIFYSNGKNWPGLGWQPQEKVLEKITSFDGAKKEKYFDAIELACKNILRPTITGATSNYKAVTIRTGALPALDGIKKIRNKAIEELIKLFPFAKEPSKKYSLFKSIQIATEIPFRVECGPDFLEMIDNNTITILNFVKSIIKFDDLLFIQKMEHDCYWLLQRRGLHNQAIFKLCLQIRDEIYANEEYKFFRILIGFDSIFHDWEKAEDVRNDYENERKCREISALGFAESIDSESYPSWKSRIIKYSKIRSNDLAMFPFFGKFLEHFGKTSPDLALKLLSESSDELESFLIAILCGVTETEAKPNAYSLIEDWIENGKYLCSLARFFEFSSELNLKILEKILSKAITKKEQTTLKQIISSVTSKYDEHGQSLIEVFFIPALNELTKYQNTDWVYGVWFKPQLKTLFSRMKPRDIDFVLSNLTCLNKIDYHAEEILAEISKYNPEKVIQFFCNRILQAKTNEGDSNYESIPFHFDKLAPVLAKQPTKVIESILKVFSNNDVLIIYRFARLIANVFPDFPIELQEQLIDLIKTKKEEYLHLVFAIFRNYDGRPIIHNVSKEIVKFGSKSNDQISELMSVLMNTGVVSGEYGFVEAYRQKIEEMQAWLKDDDQRVRKFAASYIETLEKRIEFEQKRADEEIILRKHKFGAEEI